MKKVLKVQVFAQELKLDILYMGSREDFEVDTSDLNRPRFANGRFF